MSLPFHSPASVLHKHWTERVQQRCSRAGEDNTIVGDGKLFRLTAATRYGGTAKQHEHDWKIRFFPLLVAKISFGILREGLQRVVAGAVGRGAGFLIRRKLEAPKTK